MILQSNSLILFVLQLEILFTNLQIQNLINPFFIKIIFALVRTINNSFMKTKKLNLEDFKENQLAKKQLKFITGGEETWGVDPRTGELYIIPPVAGPNTGGLGSGNGGGKIGTP